MGDIPVKPAATGVTKPNVQLPQTTAETPETDAAPVPDYVGPGSPQDRAEALVGGSVEVVKVPQQQPIRKVVEKKDEGVKKLKGTFSGRISSLRTSKMREGRELTGAVVVRATIDLATGRATNVEILSGGHNLYDGNSLLSPERRDSIAAEMASTLKNSTIWSPMPAWTGMDPQGTYIYETTHLLSN